MLLCVFVIAFRASISSSHASIDSSSNEDGDDDDSDGSSTIFVDAANIVVGLGFTMEHLSHNRNLFHAISGSAVASVFSRTVDARVFATFSILYFCLHWYDWVEPN